MITTADAMFALRDTLINDASYRETWKASIAMAIFDEAHVSLAPPSMPQARFHAFCNRAAERFLQQLEKQ